MFRLKELRKSNNLSLKELGDILGVAESTVSLYENCKREAPYSLLCRISVYFGVSVDYLLGFDEKLGNISLPMLESVSIKDGNASFNYSFSEVDTLPTGEDHFYFKMHDESMEGQISLGDIALVSKKAEIKSGDIVAVILKDSPVTLKRIIFKDSFTVFEAFNHKYGSFFAKENDYIILGRVIKTIKKW